MVLLKAKRMVFLTELQMFLQMEYLKVQQKVR